MNSLASLLALLAFLAVYAQGTSVAELRQLRRRSLGGGQSGGYRRGGDNGRDHGVRNPSWNSTKTTGDDEDESSTASDSLSTNNDAAVGPKIAIKVGAVALVAAVAAVLFYWFCGKKERASNVVETAGAPKTDDLEDMTTASEESPAPSLKE